jgi:3-hydroxyisobutyrate dehydrogenase-like beta-hydroxyacid dehydrogenase
MTRAASETVAVLGCGLMGRAVVDALAREGHRVVAWNRSPAKAQALVRENVSAVDSAREAVESAGVVISVVSDFSALHEALGQDPPLAGRTLVNLSTGSPAQAADMQARVRSLGGAYLDGVIGAFPEEIGQEGCLVNYAGDGAAFDKVRPVLSALGSGLRHVSTDVGVPAALDSAVVGLFFIPALAAFGEAVGHLHRRGVDLNLVAQNLDRTVAILGHQMHDLLTAVLQGDHDTDQATIDTYLHAAEGFLHDVQSVGDQGRLLATALGLMSEAQAAGHGARGMSAVSGVQAPAVEG